ncbi:MAG: autotransporter domain-containing protein [Gammaproteobacteria bacterium]|nr:autotransporter domain-containing protein [Gammaproteobacteria bacterium]
MERFVVYPIFLSLLVFQGTAVAAKFNYNQVSLGYEDHTVDTGGFSSLKASGFILDAAFEVAKQYAVTFSIGNVSDDVSISGNQVKLDIDTRSLGVFFHAPVAQKTDVVLGASLQQGDTTVKASGLPTAMYDLDGQKVSLGVRHMLGDGFELQASVGQTYTDDDTDTLLSFGFEGYLVEDISIGLRFTSGNDSEITYLLVSKYF